MGDFFDVGVLIAFLAGVVFDFAKVVYHSIEQLGRVNKYRRSDLHIHG